VLAKPGRRLGPQSDLAGKSLIWSTGRSVFFLKPGKTTASPEDLELPGDVVALGLSPQGQRAAVVFRRTGKQESGCATVVLALAAEELEGQVYDSDCDGRPGVSDTGHHLLVVSGGRVHVY